MRLKLTIDRGNSAVKAAVWHDDRIIATDIFHSDYAEEIAAFARRHGDKGRFDSAIYSSVGDRADDIVEAVGALSDRVIELTSQTPMPLTLDYRTPSTLGCDRIAAAVGARVVAPGRWLLVVDCGTAVTYDLVSPDGRFAGGNIAPGIFMRLEALNRFTARLPLVETDGDTPLRGYDTETALRSGAVMGVVAEIEYYHRHMPSPDAATVITGGQAALVADKVAFDSVVEPNLVSIGLNRIIDYNENI